jgi:hypothetical protein
MSKMGKQIIKGLKDVLADKPMLTTEYVNAPNGQVIRKKSIQKPSELVKKARKKKWH